MQSFAATIEQEDDWIKSNHLVYILNQLAFHIYVFAAQIPLFMLGRVVVVTLVNIFMCGCTCYDDDHESILRNRDARIVAQNVNAGNDSLNDDPY